MIAKTLADLQESVQDKSAFGKLDDYLAIGCAFMSFVKRARPTRIVSPSHPDYIFFQYSDDYGHRITRPLNTDLLIESASDLQRAFERFTAFLDDLRQHQAAAVGLRGRRQYIESKEINRVVYTVQQAIGSIGDSFDNPNQSRKRVGQLFETLVKLVIQAVGVECEPRTINIPIPGYPGYNMTYELDLVFSRNKAIIASETKFIHPSEIVGSVKTTSKDRIESLSGQASVNQALGQRNIGGCHFPARCPARSKRQQHLWR